MKVAIDIDHQVATTEPQERGLLMQGHPTKQVDNLFRVCDRAVGLRNLNRLSLK
tara:strand:+ start:1241 stop:1402 length:162 start_codon:yes stop_codon:yes gene_type:complete